MDENELQQQRDDIKNMMSPGGMTEETESQSIVEVQHEQEERTDEGEAGTQTQAQGEEQEQQEEVEVTLEERYNRLLKEHNRLSAMVLDQGGSIPLQVDQQHVQQSQAPELPLSAKPDILPAPLDVVPKFSLNKETLRKALIEDNEDAMGEVLEGMITYVSSQINAQREQLRESVLLSIPSVARQVAQQELILLGAVKSFYEENEDLQPYQSIVGAITNEITAANPQLTLQQTLKEVEQTVRQRLGLKKRIQQGGLAGDRGKQYVARPGGTRRPAPPQLDGLRKDIAAMQRVVI